MVKVLLQYYYNNIVFKNELIQLTYQQAIKYYSNNICINKNLVIKPLILD